MLDWLSIPGYEAVPEVDIHLRRGGTRRASSVLPEGGWGAAQGIVPAVLRQGRGGVDRVGRQRSTWTVRAGLPHVGEPDCCS